MNLTDIQRIEPQCPHFGLCGGCVYQDIPYREELRLKEGMVLKLFEDAGIGGFEYTGIEAAPSPEGYRNKMEFAFGDEGKDSPLALGLRKKRSLYEVVTCGRCTIMDGDYRAILLGTLAFFQGTPETFHHKRSRQGALRHLVVRKGFFTGEILVNIVTTSAITTDLTAFADALEALPLEGKLAGVAHTVNDSQADVVQADDLTVLRGRGFFRETLLGLTFKISPFSFFQTNSAAAARLYETVGSFAGDAAGKTVLDLYCGTGTIAQIVARNAKQAVGVELSAEAVDAARENAEANGIGNCEFLAGDVLDVVGSLPQPDIIILDPPRDGVHPKAIQKILRLGAGRIVYVSCKPASLVRDLQVFIDHGYIPRALRIHDMFPRTAHVESVVSLSKG